MGERRRLGKEFEDQRIDAKEMIKPLQKLEEIVLMNKIGGGTNSLSAVEWAGMEAAMPPEERQTHRNLERWMRERAKSRGVKPQDDEDDDDDDDAELTRLLNANEDGGEVAAGEAAGGDDEDEEDKEAEKEKKKREKEKEEDEEAAG